MKRILLVLLAASPVLAGPAVLEHGLVVSNGVVVDSGALLVRDGTNLVPVLKQGDVVPGASAVPDGLTIVSNDAGRLAVAPRYDANDALLAARVSMLDGLASGMADAWYWLPSSLAGVTSTGQSRFVVGEGLYNAHPAVMGKALSVGNSGKAISINDHEIDTSADVSIQAWVMRTNNLYGEWCGISMGTWSGQDGLALMGVNDQWSLKNGAMELNVYPGQLGEQWVHMVGVVTENSNAVLYLNGAPVATTQSFDLSQLTQTPVAIGELLWHGLPLNGRVDEVVIWNRGLSSNEVLALYNSGAGIKLEPDAALAVNAIAIWHLDESYPSSVLNDTSASSNHLNLISPAAAGFAGVVAVQPATAEDSVIISDPISVDASPDHARLLLSGSAGTDIYGNPANDVIGWIDVSRDGGVSWTTANSLPGGGLEPVSFYFDGATKIFTCDVALTNQPAGTSLVFRVFQPEDYPYTLRLFGASWR